MTNLLAAITVQLTLATNWTQSEFQGQQLGFLVTNHYAIINYDGRQYRQLLKTDASSIAFWRKAQQWEWNASTNIILIQPGLMITNETRDP